MGRKRNVHQDILISIVCGIQGMFMLNVSCDSILRKKMTASASVSVSTSANVTVTA